MRFTAYFLLFTIFLSGCLNNEIQKPEEIAQSIVVTYTNGPNIKNGETLSFYITNETKYCFDFSPHYNLLINIEVDGIWINVPNNINFINYKPNILMPDQDPASIGFINALPDITSYKISSPLNAYVLIKGHICENTEIIIEKKVPFTIIP